MSSVGPSTEPASHLPQERQGPSGPPTPPKDSTLLPRYSRSTLSESDRPGTPRNQTGTMSSADSLRPPSPAHMTSSSTAEQTQSSITHQSTAEAEDSSKVKRESWAKDEGSWAASTVTVPIVAARSRRKSLKPSTNGKGGAPVEEKPPPSPTLSEDKQSRSSTAKRRKKTSPSFLRRIVSLCTGCFGSSSRAHDIDVEEGASSHQSSEQQQKEKDTEKSPSANSKHAAEPQPALPSPHAQEPPSSTPIVPSPPPPLTVASPTAPSANETPDTEIAIVVPPTPTPQLLPLDETDGVTSGAVQPPGSTGDEIKAAEVRVTVGESDDSDGSFDDEPFVDGRQIETWEDEEQRLIRQGGTGIPKGPDGKPRALLPALDARYAGRKCLVLDLDETLVHSSLRPVPSPDYVVPVEIENNWHNFYVLKRPGVDNFLRKMGELYEVVVFTASLSKYADPVLDRLDPSQSVAHRLFRESCYNHRGNYVKDLSQLGRPVSDTIILDNSPASYIFHPHNAVPVSSWFNDPHDTELTDLCPFLEDLSQAQDVRGVLNPSIDS